MWRNLDFLLYYELNMLSLYTITLTFQSSFGIFIFTVCPYKVWNVYDKYTLFVNI